MTERARKAIDRLAKIVELREGKEKAAELRKALERRSELDCLPQQEPPLKSRAVTSSSRTERSPAK